jgi:hypothetical protein
MHGLNAVATALNTRDLCRARIAAVQLRVPDLPDTYARLDMELEDIAVRLDATAKTLAAGDWDPDKHPRTGTAPNPGWFAPTNESDDFLSPTLVSDHSDSTRLHLPPGERNDEIGDLLEWIANAKPEDAQAISEEINRLFYQAGDSQDGAMLHHALAEVLRNPDEATRQSILESYEPLTHHDPSEIGDVNTWLEGAALGRLPVFRIPSPNVPAGETAEEAGTAAATAETAEAASEFWKLGWAARGAAIHEALGANLPFAFKGIDNFTDGIATSIKTIDLNAATYQDAIRLSYRINDYIRKLAKFDGAEYGDISIDASDITTRVLNVAVPKGSITSVQHAAIEAAKERAAALGVTLRVTPF